MDFISSAPLLESTTTQDMLLQVENIEKELEVMLKNYILLSKFQIYLLAILTGFIVASLILTSLFK